jgi:DNA polymerase-3 subunit gamma/tau
MSYKALYRVWRPQTFQDVVGQKHIKQTLQNALQQGHFSHAYLFSGPRGTGKTSTAKILAKAINCEKGPLPEPCNECNACLQVTEGSLMDVVEIDAASNRGVEEIREIRDKIKYAPSGVPYKVYIIDEVHMLTPEAFNALLKTLEEPPAHAVFILATTEPHKLPATIISRCQRFDFRRIETEDIVDRLRLICQTKSVIYEEEALYHIGRMAEGGLRDATGLLDQAISMGGDKVTYADVLSITGSVPQQLFSRLVRYIAEQNVAETLEWMEETLQLGKSPEKIMDDLIRFYRDLLLVRTLPNSSLVKDMLWLEKDDHDWVAKQPTSFFFHGIEELNRIQTEMKWSSHPRILLEVALIRLSQMVNKDHQPLQASQPEVHQGSLKELFDKVANLEKELQVWKSRAPVGQTESPAGAPATSAASRAKISKSSGPSGSASSVRQIEPFFQQGDEHLLKKIRSKWPELLTMVKDKRITVHAWLIDGEPVAATASAVLVAFKNVMHRDTTEKPVHKELIEQAINELYGASYRLVTVMQNEWLQRQETGAGKAEDFQLVPEDDLHEEPWVKEAVNLFGSDLVEIKED